MRFQLTLDSTVGRWEVRGSFFEQDSDGFLQTPPPVATTGGPIPENFWRDYFGVLIATIPLLDATASTNSVPGNIVALTAGHLVPLAIVALRYRPCAAHYVLWRRSHRQPRSQGHAHRHPPRCGSGARGHPRPRRRGQADRYGSQQSDYRPLQGGRLHHIGRTAFQQHRAVFDSSKGFTINIPSGGGITVPGPLGDILQVAGTRISAPTRSISSST